MSVAPSEFPTATDHRLNFGVDSEKLLLVGHSVQGSFGWDVPVIDEVTGLPTCEFEPADFTGYTPEAVVLDVDDAVLATMTVTPSEGDDTGTFGVFLADTLVTEDLKANAVRWRLSIDSGTTKVALAYARFKVS